MRSSASSRSPLASKLGTTEADCQHQGVPGQRYRDAFCIDLSTLLDGEKLQIASICRPEKITTGNIALDKRGLDTYF